MADRRQAVLNRIFQLLGEKGEKPPTQRELLAEETAAETRGIAKKVREGTLTEEERPRAEFLRQVGKRPTASEIEREEDAEERRALTGLIREGKTLTGPQRKRAIALGELRPERTGARPPVPLSIQREANILAALRVKKRNASLGGEPLKPTETTLLELLQKKYPDITDISQTIDEKLRQISDEKFALEKEILALKEKGQFRGPVLNELEQQSAQTDTASAHNQALKIVFGKRDESGRLSGTMPSEIIENEFQIAQDLASQYLKLRDDVGHLKALEIWTTKNPKAAEKFKDPSELITKLIMYKKELAKSLSTLQRPEVETEEEPGFIKKLFLGIGF